MGMIDQVYRLTEVAPMSPRLREIQAVIDRVQNPEDALTEEDALAMIARLTRSAADTGPTYQKPLG